MKRIKKKIQWGSGYCAAWILAMLLLSACSDTVGEGGTSVDVASQQEVAFNANVVSSRQATRADATLINKGATGLLSTEVSGQRVGIFGCYTGPYHWLSLEKLKKAEDYSDISTLSEFGWMSSLSSDDFAEKQEAVLDSFYTSNVMFNSPAEVAAYSNGSNDLTYKPQLFWPNQQHSETVNAVTSQKHDYMTFFAYYPYNPTSYMGSYGIAITDEQVAKGAGMGQVKFTMHPDASQQNDFLISMPVMDRSRDTNPLIRTDNSPTYDPSPVQFRLFHMLAQVRFYAYIRGDDKMVYKDDNGDGTADPADAAWFDAKSTGTILLIDAFGTAYKKTSENEVQRGKATWDGTGYADFTQQTASATLTKDEFVALGLKVPDEDNCVRWVRSDIWDLNYTRRRANISYTMELNNIRTSATFYPKYNADGSVNIDYTEPSALGTATINEYIMNPYWFTFRDGKRERLNDNYMFGYYENTPVAKHYNATTSETLAADITAHSASDTYDDYDGWNWIGTNDPLDYLASKTDADKKKLKGLGENNEKHYNFARGNILLVVPQTLLDDDVPHLVITAHGKTTQGTAAAIDNSARVTINMLKMGISWESGFIYCYAFLDDLRPGDDKVRGPESITVLFNTNWYTDQW